MNEEDKVDKYLSLFAELRDQQLSDEEILSLQNMSAEWLARISSDSCIYNDFMHFKNEIFIKETI